jgi:hypothetical protein
MCRHLFTKKNELFGNFPVIVVEYLANRDRYRLVTNITSL